MKLTLLLILALALFVVVACNDYDPVLHNEPLPTHVQQVQDDEFIAPIKHSGALIHVCKDPDDDDEYWYYRVDYDEHPGWVSVHCTHAQRYER